ncbi:DUF2752 domain-containing protein [Streptomonospora sp. PA3]|uniref:DUF2752 domain-containing protein n=1 Tax=Streptomonospora sp. PA3 TaxID=2607326 RepID=UPI0012DE53D8|nr:DUF2752 domain-containing protein [Streptomonospora sp. PA3]MUL41114.1 DUF2752 domain-containing protein [Streptomonospora sp. PA3]
MSTSERGLRGGFPAWALPVRLRIEARDAHRWVSYLALGGLAAGAAMAVFGMPPVDLHAPTHYMGIMSPTCGATRAVEAAMSGDPAMSLRYNPLGLVLVAGAVAALARLAAGLLTRRWVNVRIASGWSVGIIGGALLIALWVNQQLNADLLQTSPADATPLATLAVYGLGATAAAVVAVVTTRRPRRTADRGGRAPQR